MTANPVPSHDKPDKRMQYVFHLGLLYISYENVSFGTWRYFLRNMQTHEVIAESDNMGDLRVIGDEYVEAHSA